MKIKVILLFLAMTGLAMAGGQSDTTTLNNYLDAFTARVISYTPNLYRLDSDSSEIKRAINDAMLEVSKLPRATESVDTIVMDSSFWYALNSDFQMVNWVSYVDPSGSGELGLDSIILGDIGKNTTVRQIYFDRNNYLLDTMYVYYNAYSAQLDSLDSLSNVSKYYFNIVVDQAILFFYAGRVGAAVPQIIAEAEKRLAKEYAALGLEYKSITPDIR